MMFFYHRSIAVTDLKNLFVDSTDHYLTFLTMREYPDLFIDF